MVGQLQDAGNTTTLAHYLDLLRDVELIAGLQNFSHSNLSSRNPSPKLQVFNNAMVTALSSYSFSGAHADRTYWGRLVESAVGAHILNTRTIDTPVRYWRDKVDEIDFVLEFDGKIYGMEVKSGAADFDLKGLSKFEERFKPYKTLVVGNGGISLDSFMRQPIGAWLD